MYRKRFTENLGWCSAHLKKLKIKKNQNNLKLTAAHQYRGAPQYFVANLVITLVSDQCDELLVL